MNYLLLTPVGASGLLQSHLYETVMTNIFLSLRFFIFIFFTSGHMFDLFGLNQMTYKVSQIRRGCILEMCPTNTTVRARRCTHCCAYSVQDKRYNTFYQEQIIGCKNKQRCHVIEVLFQKNCSGINNSHRGLFQVLHNYSRLTPFILTVIVVHQRVGEWWTVWED